MSKGFSSSSDENVSSSKLLIADLPLAVSLGVILGAPQEKRRKKEKQVVRGKKVVPPTVRVEPLASTTQKRDRFPSIKVMVVDLMTTFSFCPYKLLKIRCSFVLVRRKTTSFSCMSILGISLFPFLY